MPNPSNYTLSEKPKYMQDCMHQIVKVEKKDRNRALAQCLSVWKDKHMGKNASDKSLAYKNPHPNYVKDHKNCPVCGEPYKTTCKCRIGNKTCANKHGWHTCGEHNKVFVGDSHELGTLREGSRCVCPIEETVPIDREASAIDRVAGNLQKTIEQAEHAKHPTVFLGGRCKDNKWREELKKEFKDKLFFIDPYDPDWDPEENIYEELAAIINADHSIFYDGGEGSDKEMEFLDNTDRDYEEFADMKELKGYLNRLAEPVVKMACISKRLRVAADILLSHEKFGFVGIKVPASIASKIQSIGKEIPNIHLYKESGSYGSNSHTGRELDTHITLVYGLTFKDPNILKEMFKDVSPFTVTLNKTSMFTENPKCDVLKVGVNSPALQDLHEKIRSKFHPKREHPGYYPHVTVAYLKKGYAESYLDIDFSEYTFKVDSVYFEYNNKKTTIKLLGR